MQPAAIDGRQAGASAARRTPGRRTVRTLLLCLLVAGLTWATYSPSLRNGFVALDDNDYIVVNPLVAEGRLPEARAQYEEVLRRDPQSALARLNLSVVLLALGQIQDSQEQYRVVLSTASGLTAANLVTLLDLGVALVEKGSIDDGIRVLERAVQIDPTAQDARNNLGAALATAGRLPQAAEVFRAAVALNDHYLDARLNLGQILVEIGQAEEGIRHLLAAVTIEPEDERVRKALAQSVRKDGGAALKRVLDQDPKLEDAVRGVLETGRPGASVPLP